MESMSEIRCLLYGGYGGFWLEEFVGVSFYLCSVRDMPSSAFEGAVPDCPYCGKPSELPRGSGTGGGMKYTPVGKDRMAAVRRRVSTYAAPGAGRKWT